MEFGQSLNVIAGENLQEEAMDQEQNTAKDGSNMNPDTGNHRKM